MSKRRKMEGEVDQGGREEGAFRAHLARIHLSTPLSLSYYLSKILWRYPVSRTSLDLTTTSPFSIVPPA